MHVLDGLYDIWELVSMVRSSHMRELRFLDAEAQAYIGGDLIIKVAVRFLKDYPKCIWSKYIQG